MRFFVILCSALSVFSQTGGEFSQHPNGLIYDEESMTALRHLVAVEDRNFNACPTENTYQTQQFILTDFVLLEVDQQLPNQIRKYLNQSKRAEDVVAEFADRIVFHFQDVPVIRYSGYDGGWVWREPVLEEVVDVKVLAAGKIHLVGPIETFLFDKKKVAMVFFPKTPPTEMELAPKYARMVDYVDCMVGNMPIFHGDGVQPELKGIPGSVKNPLEKFQAFLDYGNRPEIDWSTASKKQTNRYFKDIAAWHKERSAWIQEVRTKDPKFLGLLQKAVAYVGEAGGGSEELEALSEQFLTKPEVLSVMRSRQVVGRCSMDQSPRIHAQKVATLAAETAHWEIFLRAHLNILNDHFDRVSDGSYAFGRRKTYFRELEALGLDLPMLIPGLTLYVADPHPHHYVGSPMRLGRALAEADDPQPILDELLKMLADPMLNPPNKWQVTYVLINFLLNHDEEKAMQTLEQMIASHPELPDYVAALGAFFISK